MDDNSSSRLSILYLFLTLLTTDYITGTFVLVLLKFNLKKEGIIEKISDERRGYESDEESPS